MIADMVSEGWQINVATEVQKGSQADFAVRGTLSSSNVMRRQINAGDDFVDAPDTVCVYILGFNLPELKGRDMFVSRIIRAEYESREYFLADKYSDYYIELPKMDGFTKQEIPKEYHDIWDLCVILKTKIKDQEEVIRMQAVESQTALNLAMEAKKAVASDEFVNDTMKREQGIKEIQAFFEREKRKAAQAAQDAAQKAAQKAMEAMEKMIITALQCNTPSEAIEAMRDNAGITETRLAELREQAKAG
jgi:hypothetical protein